MQPEHAFVTDLLNRAIERPRSALVELWCRLDHPTFERGFQREACEAQAATALAYLDSPRPLADVHPAAALRAISRRISESRDGFEVESVAVTCEHCGGAYYLVKRPTGWRSRVSAARAGHREYWLEGLQIVPARHGVGAGDLSIEVVDLPAHVRRRLGATSLRFVAGGFDDAVQPDWGGRRPYWSTGLSDAETRWSSLTSCLDQAVGHRATCLVLPELTLDRILRRRLAGWLRDERHELALVLAGTFHEVDPDSNIRRNIAYLLDGDGREIGAQRKLKPMRTVKDGKPVDEDVEGYARTVLRRASFGLVGTAVCLDFCFQGTGALDSLWQVAGPALMLVPSMAGERTNRRHRRRAEELSELHATATLVASQHPEVEEEKRRRRRGRVPPRQGDDAAGRDPAEEVVEPRCLGISTHSGSFGFEVETGEPFLQGEIPLFTGLSDDH